MRAILYSFFIVVIYANSSFANNDVAELKSYVNGLIDDGYDLFRNDDLSESEVEKRTRQLIRENLHIEWMAKYTLGRHRKNISESKIKEFIGVYKKFVVTAYTNLSTNYDGAKATVKSVKKLDNTLFMVHLEIIKPGSNNPIKVDYLIHKMGDEASAKPYLIGDIITEGISILYSQQLEFNSVIGTRGIDSLMLDLKNRTKS